MRMFWSALRLAAQGKAMSTVTATHTAGTASPISHATAPPISHADAHKCSHTFPMLSLTLNVLLVYLDVQSLLLKSCPRAMTSSSFCSQWQSSQKAAKTQRECSGQSMVLATFFTFIHSYFSWVSQTGRIFRFQHCFFPFIRKNTEEFYTTYPTTKMQITYFQCIEHILQCYNAIKFIEMLHWVSVTAW